jgi:putative nucleotidyltransferase with HDIG domain
MGHKNILIFNENAEERQRLAELLRAEDFTVFDTPRVLEAIHILKNNDINMVLASQNLNGMESGEFRELVEHVRPGVSVLFVGQLSDGNSLAISQEGFKQFLQDAIRSETSLRREIKDLKHFFFSFADRLIQIFEVNNRFFFNNDHLVAEMARKIAVKMGLEEELVEAVQIAALLKDIGKVGIQRQLLEDTKRLNQEELTSIKTHPINTVQILKQINFPWNVDSIIAQHHENYDGSGYPLGLRGREISLGARIIHIADSYIAMTTDRPYRKAIPRHEAIQEIVKKAGTHFDPEIVEVFLSVIKEETPQKIKRRSILLLERQPTITALIRLSVDVNDVDILHASNTFDAVRIMKQTPPDLVIADVEMLDKSTFFNFYKTIYEIPAVRNIPFIFILPDKDYPRHFNGKKVSYIVSPLDLGELTSTINSILAGERAPEEPPEEAKGLSGTLEDFSLADIIQILNLGLKTAKVELTRNGQKGAIYLLNGKVVHASVGDLQGKDAFFEMFGWDKGMFRIIHGLTTPEVNINIDTMHLLLQTARLIDEKRIRSYG